MPLPIVLLVEDDRHLADLLTDSLERTGFSVQMSKDAESAVEQLQIRLPDLMLADISLPDKDGFYLVEELRNMVGGDSVPVVLMSGIYRTRAHKERAEGLSVVGYMDKPFGIDRLNEVMREVLGDLHPQELRRRRSRASPRKKDSLASGSEKDERAHVEELAKKKAGSGALKGNFRKKPFAELLGEIARRRLSGGLLVKKGDTKKVVFFSDGFPIFVKSNLLGECLGRVLVSERLITQKECEKSLRLMRQKNIQQGQVLVEMAVISSANLAYGLQLQLEAKLLDIFSWNEGGYQFHTRLELPAQSVKLDMSLATVIYEGVRRQMPIDRVRALLSSFERSFLAPHPNPLNRPQDMSLEADERRLLALIDGKRTLTELRERGALPSEQVDQLVYALLSSEMIQASARKVRRTETRTASGVVPPPLKKRASKTPPLVPVRSSDARLPPLSLCGVGGAELAPEVLKRRLAERVALLSNQNPFEVLGLSRAVGDEEAQKAKDAFDLVLNQSRLEVLDADGVEQARQLRQSVENAYARVATDEKRADTVAGLEAEWDLIENPLLRIFRSEVRFSDGETAARGGEWASAVENYRAASRLRPTEGEFHASLGWALFHESPNDLDQLARAEQHIRDGIQLSPRAAKSHLFLGYLLKATDRLGLAQKSFQSALECDPDSMEARAELSVAAFSGAQTS